jgi:hypothetical protein
VERLLLREEAAAPRARARKEPVRVQKQSWVECRLWRHDDAYLLKRRRTRKRTTTKKTRRTLRRAPELCGIREQWLYHWFWMQV